MAGDGYKLVTIRAAGALRWGVVGENGRAVGCRAWEGQLPGLRGRVRREGYKLESLYLLGRRGVRGAQNAVGRCSQLRHGQCVDDSGRGAGTTALVSPTFHDSTDLPNSEPNSGGENHRSRDSTVVNF